MQRHENELLTVGEAGERYDGQWTLMRITEIQEYDSETKGYVVLTGKRRQDIHAEELRLVLAAREKGDGPYFVFRGFKRVPWPAELRYLASQDSQANEVSKAIDGVDASDQREG